jgi:hypothetical protein
VVEVLALKAVQSEALGLPYKSLAVRSAVGQALASKHLEAQAVACRVCVLTVEPLAEAVQVDSWIFSSF